MRGGTRPGAGRPPAEIVDGRKRCCVCHRWKGLHLFYRQRATVTGDQGRCKACDRRHYHATKRCGDAPPRRTPAQRRAAKRADNLVGCFVAASPLGIRGVLERFDSLEIFERDRWTCHICRGPVARWAKRWRNRPSVDHIVLVSAGGLHSRANVKLAHRRCNAGRKTP